MKESMQANGDDRVEKLIYQGLFHKVMTFRIAITKGPLFLGTLVESLVVVPDRGRKKR